VRKLVVLMLSLKRTDWLQWRIWAKKTP